MFARVGCARVNDLEKTSLGSLIPIHGIDGPGHIGIGNGRVSNTIRIDKNVRNIRDGQRILSATPRQQREGKNQQRSADSSHTPPHPTANSNVAVW